jgi:hypothetical protein
VARVAYIFAANTNTDLKKTVVWHKKLKSEKLIRSETNWNFANQNVIGRNGEETRAS